MIYLNVFLLVVLCYYIYVISKKERDDVVMLNNKFLELRDNRQCLDYLQLITTIPFWRFCVFSSAGYTMLLFLLYTVSGFPITNIVMGGFWLLFLLNATFLYKMLATRDFHYICKNSCNLNW